MFNNRLNGKWSKNGDGHEEEMDDAYLEDDGSSAGPEKIAAIELASSMRGQWLIGMALYELLLRLEGDQKDELTKESVTILTDMGDVETLISHLFPLYRNVVEREDDDE